MSTVAGCGAEFGGALGFNMPPEPVTCLACMDWHPMTPEEERAMEKNLRFGTNYGMVSRKTMMEVLGCREEDVDDILADMRAKLKP